MLYLFIFIELYNISHFFFKLSIKYSISIITLYLNLKPLVRMVELLILRLEEEKLSTQIGKLVHWISICLLFFTNYWIRFIDEDLKTCTTIKIYKNMHTQERTRSIDLVSQVRACVWFQYLWNKVLKTKVNKKKDRGTVKKEELKGEDEWVGIIYPPIYDFKPVHFW